MRTMTDEERKFVGGIADNIFNRLRAEGNLSWGKYGVDVGRECFDCGLEEERERVMNIILEELDEVVRPSILATIRRRIYEAKP